MTRLKQLVRHNNTYCNNNRNINNIYIFLNSINDQMEVCADNGEVIHVFIFYDSRIYLLA